MFQKKKKKKGEGIIIPVLQKRSLNLRIVQHSYVE